ncbi:HNH endonuclease [Pseudorhodoferax sp. Leaf274]|uniref:HNH endonuclease n=1 Tax=Pseudorhodoferax sp. Leaf274 TaxID=1736318 RepID=UPI000702C598|nr:HNH endonuclease [Pseudorhodoferax sp. Leaf274]KQP35870.1 hypothetical protein ASF44_21475 [Pseudorhodoferax sp. Leaf274]
MKLRTLKPAVRSLGSTLRTVSGRADSWRAGKTTAERGYGARWQRARGFFLQRNPLCCFCHAVGRVEIATVVDHIRPHNGDMQLFWDRTNWQPLCKPCHDSTKKRMENGGFAPKAVGLDGWPKA